VPTKEVPITPEVLAWAVRESGFTLAEVADQVGVDASVLGAWLSGKGRPGITQFRKIAQVLRRPTATFLLPAAPKTPEVNVRSPGGALEEAFAEVAKLPSEQQEQFAAWIREELEDERWSR
jgi:transcriptional regulator with XRE-family HTH domain